jgi:hypothetical protein
MAFHTAKQLFFNIADYDQKTKLRAYFSVISMVAKTAFGMIV